MRDLFGAMLNEGANEGMLVCTSGYGPNSYNFSEPLLPRWAGLGRELACDHFVHLVDKATFPTNPRTDPAP